MQASRSTAAAAVRHGAFRPGSPTRPADDGPADAQAVVIHSSPQQSRAATGAVRVEASAAAPSFLTTRASHAHEYADAGPSLCDRARRVCCRATLSLASGVFLGGAIGGLTALGLSWDGYEPHQVAAGSIIGGSVGTAVMSALSWYVIGDDSALCGPAPGQAN